MIVIGVLLLLIAAGAVGFVVMAPASISQAVELTAMGVKVSATPLASFVAGALSVVMLILGIAMIGHGARRRAKSRKELHDLRKEQAGGRATPPATSERAGP
jgi:membrane protein implicated in regulation of membrane protease activity